VKKGVGSGSAPKCHGSPNTASILIFFVLDLKMSLMCIWIRIWLGFGTFFLSDQDLLLKIRKSYFLFWANISFFVKKFCFKRWWYYNMVNLNVVDPDSLGSVINFANPDPYPSQQM
jgi:hypothetical protein